ncbi:MAG TPA: ribonuclease HII [Microbacteriaceae bacterium]|nr:ribonuclease HII [Microbacteriaceae bacterium]
MIAPTLEVELELVAQLGARMRTEGGLIIGMDEVGRGAVAGPVAVGAVALDPAAVEVPDGLRDSKLLTERRREALYPVVTGWGTARGVGLASSQEVDELGIIGALGLAGARALVRLHEAGVGIRASVVLLDGSHDWLTPALRHAPRIRTRVKADRDCASVAGASVLAKVHRDRLMATSDIEHPGYGWARNKGYGAPDHLAAVRSAGPSPLHRLTFLGNHLASIDGPSGAAATA